MIARCTEEYEIQEILNYIGEEYKKVPYIYVNLLKYGIGGQNVKSLLDRQNGAIQGVYLLYYDCLHFFTKERTYTVAQAADVISALEPKVVMLQSEVGSRIERSLSERYSLEKNYVLDLNICKNGKKSERVELAGYSDMERIANLMLTDPIYQNVYQKDTLVKQLQDRYQDRFSRFFAINDEEGEPVAVYSTYGEAGGLAILNGLLVHPRFRRRGFASELMRHGFEILGSEGIEGVSFVNCNNKPSLNVHEKLGADRISLLYKFVKFAP